ncbi:hypothetical protein RE474_00845 [Methanolobus sediminis]|uniref:Uncharacterized protein n=1 Tax=Methanolobus sediminis TaxID=3072978 RepID=A0AA51UKM4_9EURY|nr:hypothetical protein [Methanolobus sediminis]WMW25297.1 hypothetical protein RE474_00845 [Methanolobus sediminis]
MVTMTIIFLIFLLIVGLVIGFLQFEFVDKKMNGLEEWFHSKNLETDKEDISFFSLQNFVGLSSSFILKIFERINNVTDVRLKKALKIDSLLILSSISAAAIYYFVHLMLTITQIVPAYVLAILLAFSLGPIIGFTKIEFAESIIFRIENWLFGKKAEYETRDINYFSRDKLLQIVSYSVIKVFKLIDNIQDRRLKAGLKLDSVFLVVLTISGVVLTTVSVIVFVVILVLTLYLIGELLEMWYRHQKGLPLFPRKDTEYYEVKTSFWDKFTGKDRKTVYNMEGNKVADVSTGFWDETFGIDRQTIKDAEGNKVGDISTGFWDKTFGIDRQIIKDAEGNKVGDISTGLWDETFGNDRKIIRDAEGNEVGDIIPTHTDDKIVSIKKNDEEEVL